MHGDRKQEPSLSELLEDPLVLLLMARDGVTRHDIVALMTDMRIRSLDDIERYDFPSSRPKSVISESSSASNH